jgi:hypothetical protein
MAALRPAAHREGGRPKSGNRRSVSRK